FNKIKNFDLKKSLETLLDWIRELISTTKDLAERAFNKLSKAEKKLLTKMKLVPEEFKDELLTLCPLR
ncbi:hypothetical protein, partial [Kordia sp.]|uniref:hypothetical protein n=1 Tax=Kordia sp. TaxID=1965332 RepID=UPI0025C73FF0